MSEERFWRLGPFLDRNWVRCLLWNLRAVVDGWVRGRRLWKSGGSGIVGVESGRRLQTVVKGMVWWVVLGCRSGVSGDQGVIEG